MYPYGQGQPQQPLYSQPTGQSQQPLYGQPTGQPQYAGYPGSAQPQQPMMPSSTGYQQQQLQSFPTGYPQQQQPQPLMPTQTGYGFQTPSSVSANASNTYVPGPSGVSSSDNSSKIKIPNIRLSFITADDQEKFEQLFRSAVSPQDQALSGDRAKQILLRSNLSPNTLGDIWQLSDTTKSGTLMFPEFALAMYLCSLAIKGQALPTFLPEKIKNEVSSLVDIISFSFDDTSQNASQTSLPSNVPDFRSTQPQQTGYQSQLTGATGSQQPLQSQSTGYHGIQPQPTGVSTQQPLQSQPTGYQSSLQLLQPLQPQATGYIQQPLQPQSTGGGSSQTLPLQTQMTGYPNQTQAQAPMSTGLISQPTGITPLSAMPTGKPGQWGFINTPTQGLPGIEALRTQLMPQRTGTQSVSVPQAQLQGNARVEWAITKDEKQVYDSIFNAWDKTRQGYITGDVAIDVFGKSGLNREDLAKIWALADPDDRGRLSKDEFAVAMHLVYRTLNNHPLPNELPAELVPPSQRRLSESVSQIKSFLRSNPTGTSTASSRFQNDRGSGNNWSATNKDAVVFKNNDDEMGSYVSNARHKSRKPQDRSTAEEESSFQKDPEKMSLSELQKAIREKKILLDAIDAQDEEDYSAVEDMESKNSQAIEDLRRSITNIQKEINKYPNAPSALGDSSLDKRQVLRKLHAQTDLVPQLVSSIKSHDDEIVAARLELFRLEYERDHPGATISGTGPNGQITDVDRRRARSKAILRRANALTRGTKNVPTADSDIEAFESAYAQERSKYSSERDAELRMFVEIQESVSQLQSDLERSLKETPEDIHGDRDRRRWEEAIGVEDDTKDFIYSLRRLAPSAPAKNGSYEASQKPSSFGSARDGQLSPSAASSTSKFGSKSAPSSTGSSTAGMNPAERAAHIRAEADRKMTERLAALGITRKPKNSSNAFQPPSSSEKAPETSSEPTEAVKQPKTAAPQQPAAPLPSTEEPPSDEDDDDEEELLKARAEQEARLKKLEEDAKARKEKDSAKKQQKEKRRQALLAEIEAAKERERKLLAEDNQVSSDDDEPVEISKPVERPSSSALPKTPVPGPAPSAAVDNNPFLKDKNPFFKPQGTAPSSATSALPPPPPSALSTKETIDPVEAARQREKQQGNATDDEWGDGGGFVSDESSDDEDSNRGNPVALASRLFGSIGASRSATSSTVGVETKQLANGSGADVPPPPPPAEQVPVKQEHSQSENSDSDNDSAFATPSSGSPVRQPAPGIGLDSEQAVQQSVAPQAPPPPVPNFSNGSAPTTAPPAPPRPPPFEVSEPANGSGAPSVPPPPPPPAPPANGNAGAPTSAPPGLPDTSGLFADIMKGKSLKKVAAGATKSSGPDLGRIL